MDGGVCSRCMTRSRHPRNPFLVWAALAVLIPAISLLSLPAFAGSVMGQPESHTIFELGPTSAATNIIGDGAGPDVTGPDWADIIDCSCVVVPCGVTSGRNCALRDTDGDGTPDATEVWGGIGATFLGDPLTQGNLTDCTTYAQNNTNDQQPSTWNWITGNAPGKNDITNAYIYATFDLSGDLFIYGGAERRVVNGDTHLDIEFNQSGVGLDKTPECGSDGTGGAGDASPCEFTGAKSVGDIVVSMDYVMGGNLGSLTVRRWDGLNYTEPPLLTITGAGGGCNAAVPAGPTLPPPFDVTGINGDVVCGFTNGSALSDPPVDATGCWDNFNSQGNVTTTLDAQAFVEFGFNASELIGLTGVGCFATVNFHTRASQSFTAELHDFAIATLGTCDDDNACTSDACVDGQCVYTPITCNDDNSCTDDSCDPSTGCVFTPDNTNACTDDNACTSDVCVDGACVSTPNAPCDDGVFCTDDVCNPQTGCVFTNKADSTPCADTGLDCWNAGCEQGVCVQNHTPVGASTPCDDSQGTECTDPGCDGAGNCDPLHINRPDSQPCTDTGIDCWNAGCEAGVCVQEHVAVAASVPCDDSQGTECTDPGCDGAGNCDPLHINRPDSQPCTDTGIDCWNAGCEAGVCVQTHVAVAASVPCDDVAGTECTTPGCDGAGNCDPLHINRPDSLPCTDTGIDCWNAGCEAGVCVQTHVAVAASVPCDDVAGTECTDPGCDGAGNCDPLHINRPDSQPCTDTGIDCWNAGCEAGVCVQTHVAVAASTPCDDVAGTECTDPGCDGSGNCDPLHIPKQDSTPCSDTGIDCWDAGCEAGVCVQEHVAVAASVPCDDVNGTECTDPGCDGAGNCDPLHINRPDSQPCTDTGIDCWNAGCEAGACVQEHVAVAASVPCDDVAGTECTSPGCDGQGNCDPLHINRPDSLPCTDLGIDCWVAGCEAGTCVQTHLPVAASVPCDDSPGTECTNPGCDGAGNCDPLHINRPDSLPCTDTGIDCWNAGCEAGVCVQEHVAVAASVPCDDSQGTECTDPGCDGAGNCDPLHINRPDSQPCTDTGLDCWNAGCEAGVCVQTHVAVAASVPCDDVAGTECTDPGCDGTGNCDPLHIARPDSTPCTDTGNVCFDPGCQAGVCDQQHVDTSGVCDDLDPCTIDTCNPLSGCDHSPDPACAVEICRTPGFWGTHADEDPTKDCSRDITAAVIAAGGGSLSICGECITNDPAASCPTSLQPDDAASAIEAMCVKVQRQSARQLARQLTAAALNCIVSGHSADCTGSSIASLFADCNSACTGGPSTNTISQCIAAVDCYNNGFAGVNGSGGCTGTTGCHDRPLPLTDLTTCTPFCSEGSSSSATADESGHSHSGPFTVTLKPGPAGSSEECSAANDSACTVIQPNESLCGTDTCP